MSSYNRPVEDIDTFIDFNGGFDNSNYADESHPYTGPSHEYDRFRQQTGLPTGAMSNISTYNDMNIDTDFASPSDFGRSTSDMSAYGGAMNFDMDFNQTPQSATYSGFYPPSSNMDDFIHPSAVYETPRPVRMYPGMHTQQAEQKAAAMAKQQSQQQSQIHHMAQQPSSEQHHFSGKGKARSGSQSAVDPIADRRISEILDNMRHRSAMSPIDENDGSGDGSDKAKKEDEEMDEDERLLASEEGRKLSSKERRQLRNKVSARAFRSRRKEYIGQLEGDLATKANETNDLRAFNRKLLDENNQLKNLTRTLLSHPAFHTFLEDMSRNQTFVAGPAPQHLHMPTSADNMQSQQQNEIKQEPESQPQQQQQSQQQDQLQVNMARLPESSLDMSMLNLGNNHWANQSSGFQYTQPQVFAVFELPQPSMEELRRPLPPLELTTEAADVDADATPSSKTPEEASRAAFACRHSSTDFSLAALTAQLERSLAHPQSRDLDLDTSASYLGTSEHRRIPLVPGNVPGR